MRFALSRLLQGIVVLLLVSLVAFLLLDLGPGDSVSGRIGGEIVDQAYIDQLNEEYGLDKPILVRYWKWLEHTMTGDLGNSTRTRQGINGELKGRVPATLHILVGAVIIGLLIGVPVGVLTAYRSNTWADNLLTIWATAGISVPSFLLAVLAIFLFAVKLDWLPATGYVAIWTSPTDSVKGLVLPCAILGWEIGGILARHTRSSVLEVLRQDYIRTARAKGLGTWIILWRHALRNGLLPVVTVIGLLVGRLVSGVVVLETIFSVPGVGRYVVTAVANSDYTVVQAVVLLAAAAIVTANFLADLAYAILDPRIRRQTGAR